MIHEIVLESLVQSSSKNLNRIRPSIVIFLTILVIVYLMEWQINEILSRK